MNLFLVNSFKKLQYWFNAQSPNFILWLPIILSFGMGLYFIFPTEPGIWALSGIFTVCTVTSVFLHKHKFIALLLCMGIGFGYAGIYTHIKHVPQIPHSIHNIEIYGQVTNLEYTPDKPQIYMTTEQFGNIRVSCRTCGDIYIGDKIYGTGGLFKPGTPYVPNGFDFARWAYFNNITATGYIDIHKIIHTPESTAYSIREHIHNHTNSFLTDTLVLGYKKSLPKSDRQIWSAAGVSHIWSISGYHISLIGGWMFILFYLIFRSIPYITRHIPARKPALVCAWIFLMGYVLVSGASVATLRAFIMTTLIMLALILERGIISLRTISLAMLAIIISNPYYVTTAGFQLSFAAIFGIIWLWSDPDIYTPQNKILKYLYTALLTALVATIFTTPFIAMHFNSIPIYGILGNFVLLPIFSIAIMPLVIIGTVLAMFDINELLQMAHHIYNHTISIATHIASIPGAEISTGPISIFSFTCITLGLCCIIFIRNVDTYKTFLARHVNVTFGTALISMGIITWICTTRPIFYISPDHKLIGAVIDGKLKFNKSRDSDNYFAFDTWKKFNRERPGTENQRIPKESGVYTISYKHFKIAYIQNFVPLANNIGALCADPEIKYIASYFRIESATCKNKIIHGGATVYNSGRVEFTPTNRHWHNPPE